MEYILDAVPKGIVLCYEGQLSLVPTAGLQGEGASVCLKHRDLEASGCRLAVNLVQPRVFQCQK